jgi:phosphoribosyl 1,2-cyclic phosphodiesterase
VSGADDFYVRFWGVRGSIASASPNTTRYGGNTVAVEVRCGKHMLMIDCGSGARFLGNELCDAAPLEMDIFLSHTHYDHINGLPFFGPLFDKRNFCRINAGHLLPERTLKDVLADFMKSPFFPVPPAVFGARIEYLDFTAGATFEPRPNVRVRTAPLNHPDRATGYRIEYAGHAICYVSDTEHPAEGIDGKIAKLIQGADIVIYDAMYTEAQYDRCRGWGHSTWQAGVELCAAAGAKTLVLFHHNPDNDDNAMDAIAREVDRARPGSLVAREGMVLRP